MGTPLACILWCLPAFLILTRVPRPPRTALSGRDQFIQGMTPVAVSVMALFLAGALGWLLLTQKAPSLNPSLSAGFTGTGIWIILATIGIGLFLYAFPSSGLIRPIRLESFAHWITGLAWASCWPAAWEAAQTGTPTLFLLASVFAVLPDTLDHWIARHLHRAHIHIVPDPLAPDTRMIAETLALALARCRDRHSRIRLCLYPGQTQTGQWHHYTLRFDNQEQALMIRHDRTEAVVPLPCTITTDQSFTLETGDKPLCLELSWISDGRIDLCVDPSRKQWSHSLVTAAGFGIVTGAIWGVPAGSIAGGAYALHCIIDQLGFTGTSLWFPFTPNNMAGFQLYPPSRAVLFQACGAGLTLLLTSWNGVRILFPEIARPSLISVLLLGGALPCAILAWIVRMNRRMPIPCKKAGSSRES
jgi:hypothetical protein